MGRVEKWSVLPSQLVLLAVWYRRFYRLRFVHEIFTCATRSVPIDTL